MNIDIDHGPSYGQTIFMEKTVKAPSWLWKVSTVQVDLNKEQVLQALCRSDVPSVEEAMSAARNARFGNEAIDESVRALSFWPCCAGAPAVAQQRQKMIFDTDFAFPPQDDAMALFFVLNSPELEILGITTVAGNRSLNVATTDVLKVLEITERSEIPVYVGAASPLLHKGTEWDTKRHGGWYANAPAPEPPGGFAKKKAESKSAIDYLVSTVMQNPGEVTILALGPLTNLAMAMRMEPGSPATSNSW